MAIRIKQPKFRNKRCTADGFKFDSQKERDRYFVLKTLAAAGEITDLAVHPHYVLVCFSVDGSRKRHEIGQYVADFEYRENRRLVVEDVKGGRTRGTRTELYRWKKRHFEAQFGIKITEV